MSFNKERAKTTLAILTALGCLTSCGGGSSSPTPTPSPSPDLSGVGSTSNLNNTTASGTTSTSFALIGFSPDSSTSSIPTQVTASFNKPVGQTASSASNWTYTCSSGSSGVITNISASGQQVVLTLSPVVASGSTSTVCTLQALSSILSSTGDTLMIPRSVSYLAGPTSSTTTTATSSTPSFMAYIKDINSSTTMMGVSSISLNVFPTDGNGTLPASIQLVLDSVPIYRAPYVANPFTLSSFDTMQFPNGSHVLHVNAYDAKGNKVGSDIATPVTFTIQNMEGALASACNTNKGYGTLAKNTAICVVPLSKCPIGMKPFDDGYWTTTKATECWGGSTTGCGSGRMETTEFHATFGHLLTETVTVSTLAACGPATQGSKTCSATITSIGCVIAN